ncbi:MAG: hypothetical protein IPI77_16710 [Saprospiraceae bacterium]|nr:hypothetical protein [Saprospiraceae bacterium]
MKNNNFIELTSHELEILQGGENVINWLWGAYCGLMASREKFYDDLFNFDGYTQDPGSRLMNTALH